MTNKNVGRNPKTNAAKLKDLVAREKFSAPMRNRPTLMEIEAAFAQQANARRVNAFLPAGVTVTQGRGYFYFWSGTNSVVAPHLDPVGWYSSSVAICRISQCTVGEVIREYASMIDMRRMHEPARCAASATHGRKGA